MGKSREELVSQNSHLVKSRETVLGLQALNIELQKSLLHTLVDTGILDQKEELGTLIRNLQLIARDRKSQESQESQENPSQTKKKKKRV